MAWVVDTSVLLDIITGDLQFEPSSTACLQRYLSAGLLICPVTLVELGPAFRGDFAAAETFLQTVSVDGREPWTHDDTETAYEL